MVYHPRTRESRAFRSHLLGVSADAAATDRSGAVRRSDALLGNAEPISERHANRWILFVIVCGSHPEQQSRSCVGPEVQSTYTPSL
jgi:hypothetical protein